MSEKERTRSGAFLAFVQIEIENFEGGELHEPGLEVKSGDEFICHIGHFEDIKIIFNIAVERERLEDGILLKAKYAKKEERKLLAIEALRYEAERSFFMELFWMEIKKRLQENHPDVWVRNVGIRKGWKVVYADQSNLIGDVGSLRRMF